MIHNSLFKILAIMLAVGLNWFGLSAVVQTIAYYNDDESAKDNVFSAAMLDFSITNKNIEDFIGVELGEDLEFTSVVTKTSGSLDIQYKARAEKISGNDNFCNALELEVFHSEISYDGPLLSFNTATTTALGTWAFELKLPHTAGDFNHGEECNVDLVFEGWRQDVADFNQSGFNDEERIQLRLFSRMIVLNEFLPNPEGYEYGFDFGTDSSDMPQGEWVELYNNSDFDMDLAGWYIWDASGSETNKIFITGENTYPAGTIIGAKSWLVVYMNKAVLNNTGDTVKLFDGAGRLVDSRAYTGNDYCDLEPTPADENSAGTSGECAGVPPNKSYARIPDGIGYWVDPIPTPGRMNVLEEENVIEIAPTPEVVVEETATTTENVTTTTEEIIEESIVIEEEPVAEEEPIEEILTVINEEPVIIEEEPVISDNDNNDNDNEENI